LRDVVEGQLTEDPYEAVNTYARRYQEAAEINVVKPTAEDRWKVKIETASTVVADAVTHLSTGHARGGRRPRNRNWDCIDHT